MKFLREVPREGTPHELQSGAIITRESTGIAITTQRHSLKSWSDRNQAICGRVIPSSGNMYLFDSIHIIKKHKARHRKPAGVKKSMVDLLKSLSKLAVR